MANANGPFRPTAAREDIPEIGIGMLGYGFMGKAHSNAYRQMSVFYWPPEVRPRLVAICGRTEARVAEAAVRYGYEGYYTDWRGLVGDERIRILDNGASANAHAEPTIAAVKAGKHVLCEKPLAPTAAEARAVWQAAEEAGVKHMTGFNYRFIPAVRYARELIDEGVLGRLYHFRGRWLYDGGDNPDRPYGSNFDRSRGGYGSLGNIGVHIIDLARYLMGEMGSVEGIPATFVKERPLPDGSGEMGSVTTDDAFVATVEFTSGAVGTLEASTVATGRKQNGWFEINGSKGSVIFDLERLNELRICRRGSTSDKAEGFTDVLITERTHPFMEHWWLPGLIIGWEHTFVHEVAHFIRAVVDDEDVAPHGATFEDGYRAVAVTEAIRRSWETGQRARLADEYVSEVGV